jgi:hypothetical protein
MQRLLGTQKEFFVRYATWCFFLRPSVQYLVDADGLHATDDKLKAITEARALENLCELISFLGLLTHYS